MNIKEQILTALDRNRGSFISGEQLAARFYVSRNAVWKAINTLREQGYRIEAIQNKGYCMSNDTDILSAQSISRHLGDSAGFFRILAYKAVESTNDILKAMAGQREPEGLVLIAEEQTAGRGRMNRSFYSPPGTGIYMSLLLRPTVPALDSPLLTIAAAVAVAQAIEAVSEQHAQIKWVNDVLIGGKKVCGILTEAALDIEGGGLEYVVLGIGINVRHPQSGFPQELRDIAGAVFEDADYTADVRSRLLAEVLNRFWAYYQDLGNRAFIKPYREKSMVLGKNILILGKEQEQAVALGIDDNGHLMVRLASGFTKTLSSGEVSIKVSERTSQ